MMNTSVAPIPAERYSHTASGPTYIESVVDKRRFIGGMVLAGAMLAAGYAVVSKPVYEANILIQLEEGVKPSNVLGDLSSLFDLKTGATAEMEVLRSRLVVSGAVDKAHAFIELQPEYFPLVGSAIARYGKYLPLPESFKRGGYAWGGEDAEVSTFAVPPALEGKQFELIRSEKDNFILRQKEFGIELGGRIDYNLQVDTPHGPIVLQVDRLTAKPGTRFSLTRHPRADTIEDLQQTLGVTEKGKQSGVISVSLHGSDPLMTSRIVNEIGQEYIRQASDRKADEAKKSLAFLNEQMPAIKSELDRSEQRYNEMRSRRGVLDLAEENRSLLQQTVQEQGKMAELVQKKEELMTRYAREHPAVLAVDQQIRHSARLLAGLETRVKALPTAEQDILRLERDVKVNTALYTSLLSSAQQLRLVPTARGGNARLLDTAIIPVKPVKPRHAILIALGAIAGLLLGILGAFFHKSFGRGISRPHEINASLGLKVVATLPHSDMQAKLHARSRRDREQLYLLADKAPFEPAVESLRGLRTSMQFLLQHTKNNVVLITGATPEVGKSFVSANLAAVMGSFGMRVLLIDADIRTGRLHRYFGKRPQLGLTEALSGAAAVSDVVQEKVVENVDLISSGERPAKPAELLARASFGQLLQRLSLRYDIVLIDTAPVLVTPDPGIAGAHAGAILCVARAGHSTVNEVEETAVRLNQAGLAVTGVVFNDFRSSFAYGYGGAGRYLDMKPATL
jgi:tyrosine-protein kinase Etk/Wzc